MNLALHSLLVFAPDLERARHFYGEILGLGLDGEAKNVLAFRGTGFRLVVFQCERDAEPEGYSSKAGSSIVLAVPDLDAAIAELSSKGVSFLHDIPNDGPLGRYVAFVDPFGTVHELIEPSGEPTS